MTKPINWGILGAANFALEHMGPAIQAAEGAALVALATGSASKVPAFRAFCPNIKVHETYEALIADPEVDAIYMVLLQIFCSASNSISSASSAS